MRNNFCNFNILSYCIFDIPRNTGIEKKIPGTLYLIEFQSLKAQPNKTLEFHNVLGGLEGRHMPLCQLDQQMLYLQTEEFRDLSTNSQY